jgi:hypothetical protein
VPFPGAANPGERRTEASEEVERAWEEEIIKRVEKIDSGTANGRSRSWEEIKKDFNSRFGR